MVIHSKLLAKYSIILFLAMTLFIVIAGQKYAAKAVPAVYDYTNITTKTDIKWQINSGEVKWYRYEPTMQDTTKNSHLMITLQSNELVNVAAYSSIERALEEMTYETYVSSTAANQKTTIHFPLAWRGPYFIKVAYNGSVENTNKSASYVLNLKPVAQMPETLSSGNLICPVESSTQGKKNEKSILASIRSFRDGLLTKSSEGKALAATYYNTAPYLLTAILKDATLKDIVYENLVVLQPLIEDLNLKGADSKKVFTKEQDAALKELYEIVYASVPKKMQPQLQQTAENIGIEEGVEGKKVADVFLHVVGTLQNKSMTTKVIVKFKSDVSVNEFQQQVKSKTSIRLNRVQKLQTTGLSRTYVVETKTMGNDKTTVNEAMKQFDALKSVEYVEPIVKYEAEKADIQSAYQWSLKNNGTEGIKNADIGNAQLQKLVDRTAMKDIKIAVIDTGVDNTLADLENSVLMKQGRNFINRNSEPIDDNGHGTHVAGIIAATSKNGFSIEGINQFAKIIPIKALDAEGAGSNESIALGITYAVDQGAKVINLSLGGSYSRTLESALKYAYDKNVAVIVASGNDGVQGLSYPASSKYVISVGATNALDVVADYSNYGKRLDVVAPGSNIPSLLPNGNVTYMSGTSMAAPHVTAIVGLMRSADKSLKLATIQKMLHQTTKTIQFSEKDKNTNETTMNDIYNLIGVGKDYDVLDEEEIDAKLAVGKDLVSGYGRINSQNAFSATLLKATVNNVKPKVKKITGTGIKNATVTVKKGTKVIGKTTLKKTGAYTIKIPAQNNKQKLTVTTTNKKKTITANSVVYVAK